MGRKRRKVVRSPKKRIPKIFLCPNCGRASLKVEIQVTDKNAKILCGECSLFKLFSVKGGEKEIDVYCNFIDDLNESILAEEISYEGKS